MDSCRDNIEAISMLLDGELDEAQASELRTHIDQCQSCKKVYDAFSAISNSLGEDLAEPPEMLSKGIMFKIGIMEKGGAKRRFAFGRFTAIAACLVLILFSAGRFGMLGNSSKSTEINADKALPAQVMEESAIPEGKFVAGAATDNILDDFLEDFGKFEMTYGVQDDEDQPAPDISAAQFGGTQPMDGSMETTKIDEGDLLFFINGLINYADENDRANTAEDFVFYRDPKSGENTPAELRIYNGIYDISVSGFAVSEPFNNTNTAGKPAAAFADLESLRALAAIFADAEESEESFDKDPDYTILIFDRSGNQMEAELSPLLLWISDGSIYFKTSPEAKLMLASVGAEKLAKLIDELNK